MRRAAAFALLLASTLVGCGYDYEQFYELGSSLGDASPDVVADAFDAARDAPDADALDASLDGDASLEASDDGASDAPEAGDGGEDAADADAGDDAADAADAALDADAGCPPGTKSCGGLCVSVDDPATGCAATRCEPCDFADAVATCRRGACAIAACVAGRGDCDGKAANGCETDVSSDVSRCGGCNVACPSTFGPPACVAGVCGYSSCVCRPDHADCNGSCFDGCETNVAYDARHCGGCGAACPTGPGASPLCTAGVCSLRCDAGLGDCDGDATNGCEATLASDAANCGACASPCTVGLVCSRGACVACVADADCDAGGGGTCASGACLCAGATCAAGQLCRVGGFCG